MLDSNKKEKDKVKKWKNDNIFNTESILPISEIRSNSIILKDGWYRWVIKVFWLNLDLKNTEEQQVIIEQYKKFLNWLSFPIQILVRNTYLDLTDYIEYIKNNVSKIENDVLKWQWEKFTSFISDINFKQWLIYVKEFYVIVPYYIWEQDKQNMKKAWWTKILEAFDNNETPEKIVSRYRWFIKNSKFLDTRINIVIEWLRWLWITSEKLDTADIISLLFKCYNPNSHWDQAIYN